MYKGVDVDFDDSISLDEFYSFVFPDVVKKSLGLNAQAKRAKVMKRRKQTKLMPLLEAILKLIGKASNLVYIYYPAYKQKLKRDMHASFVYKFEILYFMYYDFQISPIIENIVINYFDL
jgi:hypothetical protein